MKIFIVIIVLFSGTYSFAQDSGKSIETDTISKVYNLLTASSWQTCMFFDSINQVPTIQFINDSLLKGANNCSENLCASSNWKFRSNHILDVIQFKGCSEAILSAVYSMKEELKWEIEDSPPGISIVLKDKNGLKKYSLMIRLIDEKQLIVWVVEHKR